jgi:hypothetical protein
MNNEAAPVTIAMVGGALSTLQQLPEDTPAYKSVVRNLTGTRYGVEIPAGGKETITYAFATELMPQDLRLQIVAVIKNTDGLMFQIQAFNRTVSVVEPETSIFDPQMYVPSYSLPVCPFMTLMSVYGWVGTNFRDAASFSTSSSPLLSLAPATLYTTPGLAHCSRKRNAAVKVAIAQKELVARRRLREGIPAQPRALMERLLPRAQRPTTRAGFRSTTLRSRRRSGSRVERRALRARTSERVSWV